MHCPRLDHFVRFNHNGTVSRCGHMVDPPKFNSLVEMNNSEWQRSLQKQFDSGEWPAQCYRCQQTEQLNGQSIRLNAIKFDKLQKNEQYLVVGGTLDNICNSACQTCDERASTMIGGLKSKTYTIVDNSNKFWELPLDRVVHLDINGGEPSASKNYKHILANLPQSIKSVRINTNCSLFIDEIPKLLDHGVNVTVTASMDGIGSIYEYVRWPVTWDKFKNNLLVYKDIGVDLNIWTTVSALNIADFDNIIAFAKEYNILHSYAPLHEPTELDIRYSNRFTNNISNSLKQQTAIWKNNDAEIMNYIQQQDQLRGITFEDYYESSYHRA